MSEQWTAKIILGLPQSQPVSSSLFHLYDLSERQEQQDN